MVMMLGICPLWVYAQSRLDSIQHLDEITVVAKSFREVIPSQKLSGKELQKLNSHSVADALRYFSGVQLKDYGGVGGIKTVNIRSMGTNHMGVFYDGIELSNAQNGQVDLGMYSLDNIEEISLYNGQKSEIFQSAKDFGAEITLVGRSEEILEVMRKNGYNDLPKGVEIAGADDVVDMHDDPGTVIHKRKNSSMVIGLKMLSDGQGDAFVSAGSTGALLTGATLMVKRVKGLRRAAMGPAMPNKAGGKTVIVDCGANAECTPEFLLQFGLVGSVYAKKQLGIENPKVGLLNIGTEDSKGTALQKEAYALLKNAGEKGLVNFVGNVEARDVPLGAVDVVVCDGFNGNVLLKTIEGTAMFMGSLMKKMFKKSLLSKLGYLLCASGVKDLMKMLDYREIGGTPFLGIRKPVIKAHGASDVLAFRNAVKQAADVAASDITGELEENLQRLAAEKEKVTEHD